MLNTIRNHRLFRKGLFSLGPLLVLAVGGYLYATSGRYISTENAYIKFDILEISADVSGRVVELAVVDNQRVEKGALLFRVNPNKYALAVAHADAELIAAKNMIVSLRATYRQKVQELEEARENIQYLAREYRRQKKLKARGVTSLAKYDEAEHNLTASRQRETAVRESINVILASLGGDPDVPTERHTLYLKAKAVLDQASTDLSDSIVRAPTAGVISNMKLQVGEHVPSGRPIFSLISAAAPWVEANIKETDLTYVRVGQSVEVVVDSYPGLVWAAKVQSISPATGAEYSLLPPQNATGNWVKVVQRIPVRLSIETKPNWPTLRSGMTVSITIDTGRERRLVGDATAAAEPKPKK